MFICNWKANSFLSKKIKGANRLWVNVKYSTFDPHRTIRTRTLHISDVSMFWITVLWPPVTGDHRHRNRHLIHDRLSKHVNLHNGLLQLKRSLLLVTFDIFSLTIILPEHSHLKITPNRMVKSRTSVNNSSSSRVTQNLQITDHEE